MLNFEQKKLVFYHFPELLEKESSQNRVDFIYPKSMQRGKRLAIELQPSGNGYVNGNYMSPETIKEKGYKLDSRGWIIIKDFTEEQLEEVIIDALLSMGCKEIHRTDIKMDQRLISNNHSSKIIEEQSLSLNEKLVRSCLYNWLGYGNLNSPIWFMGMEEGGAEIWRQKTKTLEESLIIRSTFKLQMNFQKVWEEFYEIPLETFKGANVWHFIAAFLLEWEGSCVDSKAIKDYIFGTKQLGREDGNHFLGELMPLPKKSKEFIEPYEAIWKSNKEYEDEVLALRFKIIQETLLNNPNVQVIVSYDKRLTSKFLNYFASVFEKVKEWKNGKEEYCLYKITLSNGRIIFLQSTPFFGVGQLSYDGIRNCANIIKKLLTIN